MPRTRPYGTRAKSAAGECPPIIPRIIFSTLSTREFRWLHEEAWEDEHKQKYLELHQSAVLTRLAAMPWQRAPRYTPPQPVGRWLLVLEDGSILAAVEAQAIPKNFTVIHVLCSAVSGAPGWTGEVARALAFLLSAILIASRADLLRLFPLERTVGEQLAALAWGGVGSLWVPLPHAAAPLGARIQSVTIDPATWWQSVHGAASREALSYLETRMRSQALLNQPTRRQRPGIMSRLSRLLRW